MPPRGLISHFHVGSDNRRTRVCPVLHTRGCCHPGQITPAKKWRRLIFGKVLQAYNPLPTPLPRISSDIFSNSFRGRGGYSANPRKAPAPRLAPVIPACTI